MKADCVKTVNLVLIKEEIEFSKHHLSERETISIKVREIKEFK